MQISIPGKVMLSGEYAVLYGAPSVLIPVPRHITISQSEDSRKNTYSPVITEALKINIPELQRLEENNELKQIEIDREEFFNMDADGKLVKLGLGLSAAEAVGVVSLRFKRCGLDWSDTGNHALQYALEAHTKAQGGRGSGADVAVCFYQRPIIFIKLKYNVAVEVIGKEQIKKNIPLTLVWTGLPANTRKYVDKFNHWISSNVEAENLLNRLIEISGEISGKWFSESQNGLYDYLDQYDTIICDCMNSAGIDYKIPVHHEIENWAKSNGGRAKPTGAGGGDMILLIGELPLNELSNKLVIQLDAIIG
ncbi:MAG: hypothetical protein GY855_12240 [candidate division Zixibacteria bacterium]|nr:hypothetical protein [candidate division Zixibacteria bacterium]